MGVFRTVDPEDINLREYTAHKDFSLTQKDSGSGVFGLRGITGSTHLFVSESAASQSFFSGSTELATFYDIPTYYTVKHMFYEYDQLPNRQSISNRYAPFVFNPPNMFYPYNRPSGSSRNIKPIHDHINVITLPQSHFGENIKPKSIKLTDNSGDSTVTIKDDGFGNLYDNDFSASFAAGEIANGSGSVIGNVFYDAGLLCFTHTGSRYRNIGLGDGTDGFEIDFEGTQKIFEYEYLVTAKQGQFNSTNNPSAWTNNTNNPTSSIVMSTGVSSSLLDEVDELTGKWILDGRVPNFWGYDSQSWYLTDDGQTFDHTKYSVDNVAKASLRSELTSSEWQPYITTVGLYDDEGNLLVIGKTSKPIKNFEELSLSFILRFDT